ncbi:MAG: hypothetical protein IT210_11105 [Armatimonadetes bacterium]|nr:hypothetical protein [Armatimonadota bacterium]
MMRRWFVSWGLAACASVALLAVLLAGCGGGDGGGTPQQLPAPVSLETLMAPEQRQAALVGADKCAECHGKRQNGEKTIHEEWQNTIHAKRGVSCESCHGPGSLHVQTPNDDKTILTFPNITSGLVCGQCHNSHTNQNLAQYQEWEQSTHREAVADVIESGVANPGSSVSTCFRCHNSAFKVEAVDRGLDINNMTVEDLAIYAERAEEALQQNDPHQVASSANCAACHHPHKATGYMVVDGKDVQLRHQSFVAAGSAETQKIRPGATPAEYTSFNHACAQCHNGRGVNPADSALERATARPSMHDSNQYNMMVGQGGSEDTPPIVRVKAHAEIPTQCIRCHMNRGPGQHTFTVKLDACAPCHSAADAVQRQQTTQNNIILSLSALQRRMENWGTATHNNARAWDYSALGGLPAANQTNDKIPLEIKRARHNYYFVIRDASFGVHNAAYARYLIDVANRQIDKLNVPRVAPEPKSRAAEIKALFKSQRAKSEAHGMMD